MKLIDQIRELDDYNLIELHNAYCEASQSDDQIHRNDEEFFETYFTKAIDAIRAAHFGVYEYHHDFVQFNGYANLESFDYPSQKVDFDELTEWVRADDLYHEYELLPTRICEVTGEEMTEGYFFEDAGIWIKDKEQAVEYIKGELQDSLDEILEELEQEEFKDDEHLLECACEADLCIWTEVD